MNNAGTNGLIESQPAAQLVAYTPPLPTVTLKSEMVTGGAIRSAWSVTAPFKLHATEGDLDELRQQIRGHLKVVEDEVVASITRVCERVPNEISAKGQLIDGKPVEAVTAE